MGGIDRLGRKEAEAETEIILPCLCHDKTKNMHTTEGMVLLHDHRLQNHKWYGGLFGSGTIDKQL